MRACRASELRGDTQGFRGIGVNGQDIAAIAADGDLQRAVNVEIDGQPDKMTADRFGIGNQALQLLVHLFGNAIFQHTDNQAERAGSFVQLPPFVHLDQVAQQLYHAP